MLIRKVKNKVKCTPGFLVLLGILLYLDDGSGMIVWGGMAALLHELGHVFSCVLFGGRVERLYLSMTGAELMLKYPVMLTYSRENLVLLSGSVTNLLTGILALYFNAYGLAFFSFGLGVFNLLPIVPLDGGRILFNLVSGQSDPECADKIVRIVSGIFVGILAGLGCILFVKYANALPLGLSIWLLFGIIKKNRIFSPNN